MQTSESFRSHDKPGVPKRLGRRFPAEEEEAALVIFKKKLAAEKVVIPPDMVFNKDEDATLLRFLRARKLNQQLAFDMLVAAMKWRKEMRVAQALDEPLSLEILSTIRKNKPASYIGFDRQNRPLYVDRVGMLNEPAIRAAGIEMDTLVKYHIQEMEYMGRLLMDEASGKAQTTVDKCSMIFDVEGVSMGMFTKNVREVFGTLSKIDSDNYPETLGLIFVVNAGFVFRTIWKVLAGFLDSHTASKIKVLGASKSDLEVLRQYLDDSMIPSFLGGKCDYDAQRALWTKKMDDAIYSRSKQADDRRKSEAEPPGPGSPTSGGAGGAGGAGAAAAPGQGGKGEEAAPDGRKASVGDLDPEVRNAVHRIDDLIFRLKESKAKLPRKSSRRDSHSSKSTRPMPVPEDAPLKAPEKQPGCRCTIM